MIWIALTLGLVGSLHCVGMCGPLAIGICCRGQQTGVEQFKTTVLYNVGRIITYAVLGVFFGLFSQLIYLTSLQKTLSIALGVILVLSFIFSFNIDHWISKSKAGSFVYEKVNGLISRILQKSQRYNPFYLGLASGLLPCGLVYLALAGALSSGSSMDGMLFMLAFGLGTIPALMALSYSASLLKKKKRFNLNRILSFVSLFFGLFLIYRGFMVNAPEELDFWSAIRNPIMCH